MFARAWCVHAFSCVGLNRHKKKHLTGAFFELATCYSRLSTTIAVKELDFCVRNENRYFLFAIITRTKIIISRFQLRSIPYLCFSSSALISLAFSILPMETTLPLTTRAGRLITPYSMIFGIFVI